MARKIKKTQETNYWKIISPILIFGFALLSFLKLGALGLIMDNILRYLFGEGVYLICLLDFFYLIYYLMYRKNHGFKLNIFISIILSNLWLILLFALNFSQSKGFDVLSEYLKIDISSLFKNEVLIFDGGLLGALIYSISTYLLDKMGTIILMVCMTLIIIALIIPYAYFVNSKEKIKHKTEEFLNTLEKNKDVNKKTSFKNIELPVNEINQETTTTKSLVASNIKKTKADVNFSCENESNNLYFSSKNKGDYILPPLNVLDPLSKSNSDSINRSAANIKGERIVEILNSFDIPCELVASHIGPSVTKFQIRPDRGVKISKILSLSNNIKMELAAKSIRIEAPIPGMNAVGIEIPNVESSPVQMLDLIQNIPNEKKDEPLLIALGKDIMGKTIYCELNKMSHLLIAGATGSGKSVCTNAIISSILLRNHPDDVKLMLIDPKRVEFLPYKDIPHLFWPVIDDSTLAATALKKAVVIMEERYQLLAENGVRNIESYNQKVLEFNKNCEAEHQMNTLPYMVIIIDELADLMIVAGKDVEASIQQITQKARAAGIHLIVATQRPSTDVITGVIKANIPSRIAFSVASQIDSRTILDAKGAEDLLGKGDMLYVPIGSPNPLRVQGVYINDKEIKNIVEYVKSQKKVEYEPSFYNLENVVEFNNSSGIMSKFEDDLYEEVKEYIISIQKCSASIVQRRFAVGYNRAARLVDMLEENGVVGPAQGSKPREVYIKNDES